MFNKNFYPTPTEVIYSMLQKMDFQLVKYILEPSAGAGAIIKELVNQKMDFEIDAIEPEKELCF